MSTEKITEIAYPENSTSTSTSTTEVIITATALGNKVTALGNKPTESLGNKPTERQKFEVPRPIKGK